MVGLHFYQPQKTEPQNLILNDCGSVFYLFTLKGGHVNRCFCNDSTTNVTN